MEERVQHVVVMRHGDRIDHFDETWVPNAERPWDPILIQAGKDRARATGARLSALDFPIHRIFVSPFIRCRQTALEVVEAFPQAKVAIEYGLCEMLNKEAIWESIRPKDGNWFPGLSELESIFPEGSIDHSVVPIYEEMPQWGESVVTARRRYSKTIQSLANKYPHENLLLVTHGEGVWVSVTYFYKYVDLKVDYCGYSILKRNISFKSPEEFTSESFSVLTRTNETGLIYSD